MFIFRTSDVAITAAAETTDFFIEGIMILDSYIGCNRRGLIIGTSSARQNLMDRKWPMANVFQDQDLHSHKKH